MIKFTCEKAILQGAVTLAGRTVSSKSSIPAMEGILITADNVLTLSGYNMQTGIRATIPATIVSGGQIVLNARLFGDIVRRLPDDIVTFTADERRLVHLNCGDADYDILGIDAEDYPALPEVEDEYSISLTQSLLKTMIEQTAFAVATNETRPILTGVLFEVGVDRLTLVAVDGFRLAVRREALEEHSGGTFSFVAPGSALSEVKGICTESDKSVRIVLGKRHVLFSIEDEAFSRTELICRRLEGDFLDYNAAVPKTSSISVTLETRALIESIDRVSVVISEQFKSPVRCIFGHDKISLSAKTANGEAKDVCRMEGDGGELEIGFNSRYLTDALKNAPESAVRMDLSTGISPALILPVDGSDRFLYMVLPVRLRGGNG